MNTKTTFQARTVGLLVTALLAAGLFSSCEAIGSGDEVVASAWPRSKVYRIPEDPGRAQYIIVDSCGGVWYAEVHNVTVSPELQVRVPISPCR